MKISLFLITLIIIVSCVKKTKNIEQQEEIPNIEDVFSQSLNSKIHKMIEIKNNEQKKNNRISRICSVIVTANKIKDNECTLFITLMSKIDSDKITGYTFWKEELIACYLLTDPCNNVINKDGLIKFKDSIPGYPNLEPNLDHIYDAPLVEYQIKQDSLLLINTSFINSDIYKF